MEHVKGEGIWVIRFVLLGSSCQLRNGSCCCCCVVRCEWIVMDWVFMSRDRSMVVITLCVAGFKEYVVEFAVSVPMRVGCVGSNSLRL